MGGDGIEDVAVAEGVKVGVVIEDLFERDGSPQGNSGGPWYGQLGLGEHLGQDACDSVGRGWGGIVLGSRSGWRGGGRCGGLGRAEDAIQATGRAAEQGDAGEG